MERRNAVPWLVVSIISLLAVLIAIVIVGTARLDAVAARSISASIASEASVASESEEEQTSEEAEDPLPSTSGVTVTLDITQWNVSIKAPKELASISYRLSSSDIAQFSSDAENALPTECSTLKGGWAIQRTQGTSASGGIDPVTTGGYTYSLIVPSTACADDPDAVIYITGLFRVALASISAS